MARMAKLRRIAALGGGGFSMEPRNPRLDRWLLSLTGQAKPRVLFVPTASGDSKSYVQRFHRAYAKLPCEPAHLDLFRRSVKDLAKLVLAQDLIFVGGGNTANMLAVWRVHGLDRLLEKAWRQGTVLAGVSAGALCWFESGVTDSFGEKLQPLQDGLALLPGSFCPHYDGEPGRRPAYRKHVASRTLPPGYAADDGVAVLFEGTQVADVVSSRPGVSGWRMEAGGRESALPARRL